MPRQARKESGTGIFHVMMRGINHQNIFEDEEDNYQFINTLDRMRVRYDDEGNPCGSNCTYYAYCLKMSVTCPLPSVEHYGIADSIKVQEFDKELRTEIIISCLELGTGLRQLSRLTGVTYGVINRINKK